MPSYALSESLDASISADELTAFEPIRRRHEALMPVGSTIGARRARHRPKTPKRSRLGAFCRRKLKSRYGVK